MLRYFILQCFLSRTEESQEREYLGEVRETSQNETEELMVTMRATDGCRAGSTRESG